MLDTGQVIYIGIMTHYIFVISYIVLNIFLLYILCLAGKDMKKAIQSRQKQWIIICIIRMIIILCLIVFQNYAYYNKL